LVHVAQAEGDDGGVEGVLREGQPLRVRPDEGHGRAAAAALAHHPQGEISGGHPRAGAGDRGGRGAGAGGEVEHLVPGCDLERLDHEAAPHPHLPHRGDVVHQVVALGDAVEHRRDVVRLLLEIGTAHAPILPCTAVCADRARPIARPLGQWGRAPRPGGALVSSLLRSLRMTAASSARTDALRALSIPQHLLPADGRFGSGPSRIRAEQMETLLSVSRTVLGTSHRQAPVKQLVSRVRSGLAALFQLPEGYEVVLGNGGSTAFWDLAVCSLIERRSQHLVLGEFSQKFATESAGAPHLAEPEVLRSAPGSFPQAVASAEVDAYAWPHNETSTGVMVPVRRPAGA